MKNLKALIPLNLISIITLFAFAGSVAGQKKAGTDEVTGQPMLLINEIEADPGDQTNDSCQYIELRGAPGATIPANTYFVAIDSDNAWPGRLHHVVPVGGVTIGSNGLVYLNNTSGTACPNRTPDAQTTVVNYSSVIRIGGGNLEVGSESFSIIQTQAVISAGLDIDKEDDGILDIAIDHVFDAVAFRIDPDQQWIYPANSVVVGVSFQDVPDAIVRFPGNNIPFSTDAFYWGEIATSPVESTTFVAPLSPNFPAGGMLTPGSPNVPDSVIPTPARADFDGDGRTDISVFRGSEGNWYMNRSSDGFIALNWGVNTDQLVPADFDGDGRTDLAVFRPAADSAQPDFWVLTSGTYTVGGYSWGLAGDIPVAGDYDGDDSDDVAIYRPSDNTWYVLLSGGGNLITTFGSGSDVPVPADYDGDGTTDLAVYSDGTWNAQLSGGGTMTKVLGQDGDKLVPGDYDGDGKTDVAVYRPANGSWYKIYSSNDQMVSVVFGVATDVPVPGDYDGDGSEDVAIYRNGFWWINGSTSGVTVTQFGVASDLAITAAARP